MKNPGLALIAEEIFLNLNIQELVKCRLVSPFWREFIDGHKALVIKKLKWLMIHRHRRDGSTMVELEQFPEYQLVLDNFAKRESLESAQKFFEFMKKRRNSSLGPFHLACVAGDKDLIKSFLKYCPSGSASFNAPDRNGFTPFHRIVINGDEGLMVTLLDLAEEKGIDINALDNKRQTCLHLACVQTMTVLKRNSSPDRARIVSMLLDHPKSRGFDVNAGNSEGMTPLQVACKDGHFDVVKVLMSKLPIADFNLNFAFNVACKDGHTDIARELWKAYPTIDVTDGEVLHMACKQGHLDVVQFLLEETLMDVNVRNQLSETPLHIACAYDQLDVVNMLFDIAGNQIDVIASNLQGYNALHLACQYGSVDLILTIFKVSKAQGVELNVPTEAGHTLLHLISHYQYSRDYQSLLPLLKVLEKDGTFDPGAINENGNSALHIACHQNFVTMARFIIQSCKWSKKSLKLTNINGNTALHIACKNGNVEIVREFMNAYFMTNIDFNVANDKGITPLHLASYSGHTGVVEMLIERSKEFDINLEPKNEEGNTPLHMASKRGHLEVVKLFMKKGQSMNLKNIDGCTPLHLACSHRQKEIVELLLINSKDLNIDLNAKDNKGRTPFNATCQADGKNRDEAVETLRLLLRFSPDLRIDINAPDDKGTSPIHALLTMNPTDIKKILHQFQLSKVQFDVLDANGNTPLHLAVMLRNLEAIDFLLNVKDNGEDIQNNKGLTPKQIVAPRYQQPKTKRELYLERRNHSIMDAFAQHDLKNWMNEFNDYL